MRAINSRTVSNKIKLQTVIKASEKLKFNGNW